jgi:hypothetical protein
MNGTIQKASRGFGCHETCLHILVIVLSLEEKRTHEEPEMNIDLKLAFQEART